MGGFPLDFAAILWFGLPSSRRLLSAFAFIASVAAVILMIRLYSAAYDGTFAESMHIVVPEVAILMVSLIGIRLERRRHSSAPRTPSLMRSAQSSSLMLPFRITSPQMSESCLIKATYSLRDRVAGCRPLSSYLLFTSGSAITWRIAAAKKFMIGSGVPGGASMPYQFHAT